MKTWIKRSLIGLAASAPLAGGLAGCGHRHHEWTAAPLSAEDAAKWRARLIERAGKELQLDDAPKVKLGLAFDRLRERRDALAKLLPLQQGDFEGIFEAMAGLPVTIRLPVPMAKAPPTSGFR